MQKQTYIEKQMSQTADPFGYRAWYRACYRPRYLLMNHELTIHFCRATWGTSVM